MLLLVVYIIPAFQSFNEQRQGQKDAINHKEVVSGPKKSGPKKCTFHYFRCAKKRSEIEKT